jgi:hypothetical protein
MNAQASSPLSAPTARAEIHRHRPGMQGITVDPRARFRLGAVSVEVIDVNTARIQHEFQRFVDVGRAQWDL